MKKYFLVIFTIIISLFMFCNRVEAENQHKDSRQKEHGGSGGSFVDSKDFLGRCSYFYNDNSLNIYFNENEVRVECLSCFYNGLDEGMSDTEYKNSRPVNTSCNIVTFAPEDILPYYYADKCPQNIYIGVQQIGLQGISNFTEFMGIHGLLEAMLSGGNFGCVTYFSLSAKNDWKENLLFDTNKATYKEKNFYVSVENPTEIKPAEPIKDCEDLFGKELVEDINKIMDIVKIAIPIMLILFGIVDFTKAIFAGNEEEMAKSQKKFLNRIFASILIFFVPIFINLILSIANEVWVNIVPDTCIDFDITD